MFYRKKPLPPTLRPSATPDCARRGRLTILDVPRFIEVMPPQKSLVPSPANRKEELVSSAPNFGVARNYAPQVLHLKSLARGCMYVQPMMPPQPPLTIVKLSDNFGQYVPTLKCECGHLRSAQPRTLAAIAGWDAALQDVVKRFRCSRCGKRRCKASVRPETKRDG